MGRTHRGTASHTLRPGPPLFRPASTLMPTITWTGDQVELNLFGFRISYAVTSNQPGEATAT